MHGMAIAGVWIVVDLTGKHHPELARMFARNGDEKFAER